MSNLMKWDRELSLTYGTNRSRHDTVLHRLSAAYLAAQVNGDYPPLNWTASAEQAYNSHFLRSDFWAETTGDNCAFALKRHREYLAATGASEQATYPFVIPHGASPTWGDGMGIGEGHHIRI